MLRQKMGRRNATYSLVFGAIFVVAALVLLVSENMPSKNIRIASLRGFHILNDGRISYTLKEEEVAMELFWDAHINRIRVSSPKSVPEGIVCNVAGSDDFFSMRIKRSSNSSNSTLVAYNLFPSGSEAPATNHALLKWLARILESNEASPRDIRCTVDVQETILGMIHYQNIWELPFMDLLEPFWDQPHAIKDSTSYPLQDLELLSGHPQFRKGRRLNIFAHQLELELPDTPFQWQPPSIPEGLAGNLTFTGVRLQLPGVFGLLSPKSEGTFVRTMEKFYSELYASDLIFSDQSQVEPNKGDLNGTDSEESFDFLIDNTGLAYYFFSNIEITGQEIDSSGLWITYDQFIEYGPSNPSDVEEYNDFPDLAEAVALDLVVQPFLDDGNRAAFVSLLRTEADDPNRFTNIVDGSFFSPEVRLPWRPPILPEGLIGSVTFPGIEILLEGVFSELTNDGKAAFEFGTKGFYEDLYKQQAADDLNFSTIVTVVDQFVGELGLVVVYDQVVSFGPTGAVPPFEDLLLAEVVGRELLSSPFTDDITSSQYVTFLQSESISAFETLLGVTGVPEIPDALKPWGPPTIPEGLIGNMDYVGIQLRLEGIYFELNADGQEAFEFGTMRFYEDLYQLPVGRRLQAPGVDPSVQDINFSTIVTVVDQIVDSLGLVVVYDQVVSFGPTGAGPTFEDPLLAEEIGRELLSSPFTDSSVSSNYLSFLQSESISTFGSVIGVSVGPEIPDAPLETPPPSAIPPEEWDGPMIPNGFKVEITFDIIRIRLAGVTGLFGESPSSFASALETFYLDQYASMFRRYLSDGSKSLSKSHTHQRGLSLVSADGTPFYFDTSVSVMGQDVEAGTNETTLVYRQSLSLGPIIDEGNFDGDVSQGEDVGGQEGDEDDALEENIAKELVLYPFLSQGKEDEFLALLRFVDEASFGSITDVVGMPVIDSDEEGVTSSDGESDLVIPPPPTVPDNVLGNIKFSNISMRIEGISELSVDGIAAWERITEEFYNEIYSKTGETTAESRVSLQGQQISGKLPDSLFRTFVEFTNQEVDSTGVRIFYNQLFFFGPPGGIGFQTNPEILAEIAKTVVEYPFSVQAKEDEYLEQLADSSFSSSLVGSNQDIVGVPGVYNETEGAPSNENGETRKTVQFSEITVRLEGVSLLTGDSIAAFESATAGFYEDFYLATSATGRRIRRLQDQSNTSTAVTGFVTSVVIVGQNADSTGNTIAYNQTLSFDLPANPGNTGVSENDTEIASFARELLVNPFSDLGQEADYVFSLQVSDPNLAEVTGIASSPQIPVGTVVATDEASESTLSPTVSPRPPEVTDAPDPDAGGGNGGLSTGALVAIIAGSIWLCCCCVAVFVIQRRRGSKHSRPPRDIEAGFENEPKMGVASKNEVTPFTYDARSDDASNNSDEYDDDEDSREDETDEEESDSYDDDRYDEDEEDTNHLRRSITKMYDDSKYSARQDTDEEEEGESELENTDHTHQNEYDDTNYRVKQDTDDEENTDDDENTNTEWAHQMHYESSNSRSRQETDGERSYDDRRRDEYESSNSRSHQMHYESSNSRSRQETDGERSYDDRRRDEYESSNSRSRQEADGERSYGDRRGEEYDSRRESEDDYTDEEDGHREEYDSRRESEDDYTDEEDGHRDEYDSRRESEDDYTDEEDGHGEEDGEEGVEFWDEGDSYDEESYYEEESYQGER